MSKISSREHADLFFRYMESKNYSPDFIAKITNLDIPIFITKIASYRVLLGFVIASVTFLGLIALDRYFFVTLPSELRASSPNDLFYIPCSSFHMITLILIPFVLPSFIGNIWFNRKSSKELYQIEIIYSLFLRRIRWIKKRKNSENKMNEFVAKIEKKLLSRKSGKAKTKIYHNNKNASYAKKAILYSLLVYLILFGLGVSSYTIVQKDAVIHRGYLDFKDKVIAWNQLEGLKLGCNCSRGYRSSNLHLDYNLIFRDGLTINLFNATNWRLDKIAFIDSIVKNNNTHIYPTTFNRQCFEKIRYIPRISNNINEFKRLMRLP